VCSPVQARHKPADLCHDGRSDLELAAAIARRDAGAVRLVMRRNNQRLFRAAWRILQNREDAEDAVQSGYLKAFAAIRSFAGRSSLSTWLTRIVINSALAHARAARRRRSLLEESEVPVLDDYREMLMRGSMCVSPERLVARGQIGQIVADAIDQLPAPFRNVFVLRQIEELDVAEVAETLGIPAATVKTRHLRARRRLQRLLGPSLRGALSGKLPFDRGSCVRPPNASVLRGAGVGVEGATA
jgi:RNA polymerase sigma-70 factor (ECF subfamily)